jgi:hypothetical protein
MLAGPPVDLSAYRGRPLGREVLRGATAAVMADITGLLAQLRGKEPPAVPYDPAAARRAKAAADGRTEPAGAPAGPGAPAEAGPQAEPGAQAESGPQAEAGPQAEPPGDDPSRKAAPA